MNRFVCLIATVGAFLSVTPPRLSAQQAGTSEVAKILGISVEGNVLADPAAIIANSGLKVGDEITIPGEKIHDAITRLWSLKIFDDVQVSVERKIGDGVYLLISVKELPRYEKTEIEGRDAISSDDIMKQINLIQGQVIAPWDLVKIRRDIEKLYEKEGYLLAKVNVTEVAADTSKHRVTLQISIDEGKQVAIDHIIFLGDTAFSGDDLRGAMDNTSEKVWWKFWSTPRFDRKKFEDDKKLIVQFYQKNGYLDAQILSDSIRYSPDKEKMDIYIRVHEGPQYHIRQIAWEGNTVYPDSVLTQRLAMRPGDVFDEDKFEHNLRGNEAQNDVAALYLDNGYLRFNLEPQINRVGNDSVDIRINVYEMNQFRVGLVNIRGNTKTWDKVIRRELYTRPGDYFSRAAIMRSLRQLQMLNYFNPEKIKFDYNLVDDKTVDLTYDVEEKSSDNINASVGYSGAFGVTGALGFTINNFAITDPLSGGAGQVLNFEWEFGEGARFRTFTIGFTEPWLYGTPTLLGVNLFDTEVNYTYYSRRTGGSLQIGRRFKWPDEYFRGDWMLTAQRVNENYGLPYFYYENSTQVSLTQVISRNSVDNPVFPTSGSNVSLSIEMSGGPLLPGTIDFDKWVFNSEWYMPMFGSSKVALYLNSEFGLISGFTPNSTIPLFDRFYMGGTGLGYISTTPLRGYEDQSIGPRDASGNILGGRGLSKQTLELRFAVALNPIPIYVLAFAEGGNVYDYVSKANFFDLKRSAGLGARLQINPIGLIGFDYGYGFDDVQPLDGRPDGWHFHFVFGRGF